MKGLKRKRDHVGETSKYTWKKEECLAEIKDYQENDIINYTDLARRFEVRNEKGISLKPIDFNSGFEKQLSIKTLILFTGSQLIEMYDIHHG